MDKESTISKEQREDLRLLQSIRTAYDESDSIYGGPRIYNDLWESGERGYKKPRFRSGKPANVFANRLREGMGNGYHLYRDV